MRNPGIVISAPRSCAICGVRRLFIDDNTLHRERQPLRKTLSKLVPATSSQDAGTWYERGPRRNGPGRRHSPVHLPRATAGEAALRRRLLIAFLPHAPRPGIGLQACCRRSPAFFVHASPPPLDHSRRASYYRDAAEYVRTARRHPPVRVARRRAGFSKARHASRDRPPAYVAEKDKRRGARAGTRASRVHRAVDPRGENAHRRSEADADEHARDASRQAEGRDGAHRDATTRRLRRAFDRFDQRLHHRKSVPLANAARVACKKNMHALVDASVSLDISIDEMSR